MVDTSPFTPENFQPEAIVVLLDEAWQLLCAVSVRGSVEAMVKLGDGTESPNFGYFGEGLVMFGDSLYPPVN